MVLLYHVEDALFSAYQICKGFVIVNKYIGQNCDAFFKIRKGQNCCLSCFVCAVVLPLKVQHNDKKQGFTVNVNVDGYERM